MSTCFTDREYGTRPPTIDVIDERLWAGLYSLIQTRIGDGSFGLRFPEQCPDGNGPCGCDEQSFRRVLAAEVPWVEWPLSPSEVPATPVILDLLEFCAGAVGQPVQGSFHSFFRHYHLSWDRAAGPERFVADVNMLFSRNALAFELTCDAVICGNFGHGFGPNLLVKLFPRDCLHPLNLCRRCNVLDPNLPSRIEVGVLILPVLTILYWGARFDVCRRCLIAKWPIDADSPQNFFCPEIQKQ